MEGEAVRSRRQHLNRMGDAMLAFIIREGHLPIIARQSPRSVQFTLERLRARKNLPAEARRIITEHLGRL